MTVANSNSASNIHGLLDYAVSCALLDSKVGRVSISVPMCDLVNYGEGPRISKEGQDIVLKVEIITSYDIGTEEIETDFEPDDEDPL